MAHILPLTPAHTPSGKWLIATSHYLEMYYDCLANGKKYIKQIFSSLNCLLGKQEGFSSAGQWPYVSDLPHALLHVLVFTCLYNLGRVGPGGEIWGEWLLFNILTDCVSQAPHHLILRVAFAILAMTLLRGETCRVLFSCSHILLIGHLLQKNNLFSILRECRTLVYLLPLQNVHGLHCFFHVLYCMVNENGANQEYLYECSYWQSSRLECLFNFLCLPFGIMGVWR